MPLPAARSAAEPLRTVKQEQPEILEMALAVIGDVPAQPVGADIARVRGHAGAHLVRAPIGEWRQDVAEGERNEPSLSSRISLIWLRSIMSSTLKTVFKSILSKT